jgi:hypothetical protein
MKRYFITWVENDKRIYKYRNTKKSALNVACNNYRYNPTISDTKTGKVITSQDEF